MSTRPAEEQTVIPNQRALIYVAKLEALAKAARFRAMEAGGSAIWHLEHSVHIADLRAYSDALCRVKVLPIRRFRTKRQFAEFILGQL